MITSYREKITGFFLNRKTEIDTSMLLSEASYVVMDTELTGLDIKKDSVISIGAIKMSGGRIDIGNTFYRLINPSSRMNREGIVIHGITPSDVESQPPIEEVINEFTEYCGNDSIVGHFINMDIKFINREIQRFRGRPVKNILLDTFRIYEWIKQNEHSFSRNNTFDRDDMTLFAIAREYGITINGAHNALNDAYITAQLFQRFLSMLPALGVHKLRDIIRVGKP